MSSITPVLNSMRYFSAVTTDGVLRMAVDNIVPFPLERRRQISVCPHCGTRTNVWLIGRLLWGYCSEHELRWVVTDYHRAARATINRRELRRGLEFLSNYAEISA